MPEVLAATTPSDAIQATVDAAPQLPGVYCFFADSGAASSRRRVLYVGKANNLRQRLQSYLRAGLAPKTAALMRAACELSTTVTNNENEALLLEQTLIKQHRPRFNVLLRDDKSYPFLHFSDHKDFPYLMVRRGNQVKSGRLFGPYSSGHALRQTLRLLQTVFRIRQCSDDFFANRSRPCLQYQIGRCTAPCVGLISRKDYQHDIEMALQSLRGHNDLVVDLLQQQMDRAAARLDYERAAAIRDRLIALRKVQQQQHVAGQEGQVDVIVAADQYSILCIHHLTIRQGKVTGSKSLFPNGSLTPAPASAAASEQELLEQFISQHYLQGSFCPDMPRELLVNYPLTNRKLLENALEQQQGRRIKIIEQPRGDRAAWLKLAQKNAVQDLLSRLANRRNHYARMLELARQLDMDEPPSRIECFDISHTFGEETVASCVVFGAGGPLKASYRLFNLGTVTSGDDYAAMRQVLTRRFGKATAQDMPDLLLIDGGKGQVMMALQVLAELGIQLVVIGIAKGPTRKAGLERLFVHRQGMSRQASSLLEMHLRPESSALHLIQHLRDESHRFALRHHRKRRAKVRKSSKLEGIQGVGAIRRRELLRFFGSMEAVAGASEYDLARVNGISSNLAAAIYQHFH